MQIRGVLAEHSSVLIHGVGHRGQAAELRGSGLEFPDHARGLGDPFSRLSLRASTIAGFICLHLKTVLSFPHFRPALGENVTAPLGVPPCTS